MRYLLDTSALLAHLVDALIAAVAEVRDAVLVHRDEHMRSISSALLRQNDLSTPADPR